MLNVRLAHADDYIKVRDFYYSLIDAMQDLEYKPGWKKDVYPTQDLLRKSCERNQLFIGEMDGGIAACMVVNHEYNEGYQDVQWSVEAKDSELFVIHALGVHSAFSGQGIAKEMVRNVIEIAKKSNVKTIRLDVLEGNIPAEKTYTNVGFKYLDKIQMYYADTGWTSYQLFEYLV